MVCLCGRVFLKRMTLVATRLLTRYSLDWAACDCLQLSVGMVDIIKSKRQGMIKVGQWPRV